MNESLIKYLAGLLDADGSLSFTFKEDQNRKGLYFLALQLNLASSIVVDEKGFVPSLPKLTGMGTTSQYCAGQYITWSVSKKSDLEKILPRLIKHMVIKAKHWNWMLDNWREKRKFSKTVTGEERISLSAQSKESRKTNVGPIKPKNHPTWAWLAGYLDGDGCFTYRKNKSKSTRGYWQWTMNVSSVAHVNDICVLEFLQKSFGGIISSQGQSDNVKIWKRSLGYQNRSFALRFLPKVSRHSKLKKHKIESMIHHHRQRLSVPGVKAQAIV